MSLGSRLWNKRDKTDNLQAMDMAVIFTIACLIYGVMVPKTEDAAVFATTFAYDALGRFASVSVTAGGSGDVPRPLQTFAYSYLPGTDLVSGYTCGSFVRSVSYEPHRDIISAVTNTFNDSTPSAISTFDYANDAAGRRVSRLASPTTSGASTSTAPPKAPAASAVCWRWVTPRPIGEGLGEGSKVY